MVPGIPPGRGRGGAHHRNRPPVRTRHEGHAAHVVVPVQDEVRPHAPDHRRDGRRIREGAGRRGAARMRGMVDHHHAAGRLGLGGQRSEQGLGRRDLLRSEAAGGREGLGGDRRGQADQGHGAAPAQVGGSGRPGLRPPPSRRRRRAAALPGSRARRRRGCPARSSPPRVPPAPRGRPWRSPTRSAGRCCRDPPCRRCGRGLAPADPHQGGEHLHVVRVLCGRAASSRSRVARLLRSWRRRGRVSGPTWGSVRWARRNIVPRGISARAGVVAPAITPLDPGGQPGRSTPPRLTHCRWRCR